MIKGVIPCPICKKDPGWDDFDIECGLPYGERKYFCCGITAKSAKIWNQYAAAMELARALVKVHKVYRMPLILIEGQLNNAVEAENEAKERVLEVFK